MMGTRSKLIAGINYPWYSYGLDFGPVITAKNPSSASNKGKLLSQGWNSALSSPTSSYSLPGVTLNTVLEQQLDSFRLSGITVVRWFILGDGWNLGDPPTLISGQWTYPIPTSIDRKFTTDFRAMLQSFSKLKMRVIPVLVDFYMFGPGKVVIPQLFPGDDQIDVAAKMAKTAAAAGTIDSFVTNYIRDPQNLVVQNLAQIPDWTKFIKGGRASILNQTNTDKFMNVVFDELLSACEGFEDQIYAWDIFNEPESGPPDFKIDVKPAAYFLLQGVSRVLKTKTMRATIGFKLANSEAQYFPSTDPVSYQWRALKQQYPNAYLPQYHFWLCSKDGNPPPPPIPQSPIVGSDRSNTILGEFSAVVNPMASNRWDEVSVDERLAQLDKAKFGCALLWAAKPTDKSVVGWSPNLRSAVFKYTSQ